jgi:hypothetical protein
MSKISDSQFPGFPLPDLPSADGADLAEQIQNLAGEVFVDPDIRFAAPEQAVEKMLTSIATSRMGDVNLGASLLQNQLQKALGASPEIAAQNYVAASLGLPIPQSSIFSSPDFNPLSNTENYSNSGFYSKESSTVAGDGSVRNVFNGGHFEAYGSRGKTLAEGQIGVNIGDVDYSTQGSMGSAYVKGGVFVGARGRVFGDLDLQNRSARIGFEAEIGARAHYEGGFKTPSNAPAGVEGGFRGDAFVGARASGEAEISLNENNPRIAIGGEAFEGQRAGIEAGGGLSIAGDRYVGAHYGVEAWNGVGAAASADIGFKDGKFRFNVFAGLGLGIGGKVSWGFEINFGAISKLPGKLIDVLGSTAKDVGKGIEKVVNEAGKAATKVVDGAVDGAKKVVNGVANGVKSVVKDIGSVFGL